MLTPSEGSKKLTSYAGSQLHPPPPPSPPPSCSSPGSSASARPAVATDIAVNIMPAVSAIASRLRVEVRDMLWPSGSHAVCDSDATLRQHGGHVTFTGDRSGPNGSCSCSKRIARTYPSVTSTHLCQPAPPP